MADYSGGIYRFLEESANFFSGISCFLVHTVADSRFFKNFLYQGGLKSTVSWVFEDLKLKISEGYDQNWWFPDPAQVAVSAKLRQLPGQSQENTNFGHSLLKF